MAIDESPERVVEAARKYWRGNVLPNRNVFEFAADFHAAQPSPGPPLCSHGETSSHKQGGSK